MIPYYNETGQLTKKTGSLIAKDLPKDVNRVWKVTVEPRIEPVTLDEFKIFAKIDTDAEDIILEGFITAVRVATEEYLGKALLQQTVRMLMDCWPDVIIELPRPPLISVDGVFTIDEDDVETTYSSSNYYIVTESIPGKLILKQSVTPPINIDRSYGGFGITFKAGYGNDVSDVPRPLRDGIMLWAATVYETRVLDTKDPPPKAKAIFDLFRTSRTMIR